MWDDFATSDQLHFGRLQQHEALRRPQKSIGEKRRGVRHRRQPSVLSRDAATGLSNNHRTTQEGRTRRKTPAAGRESSWRSPSAPICNRRANCRPRSRRSFPRTRSTASTTTLGKSRFKTSSRCVSQTRSSSQSGTETTCRTCRSRRLSRSASKNAAATTITPARCAI